MTKTTNYQLNQWEKTDRIMMDDFNADNAKLETALTKALTEKRAIKTVTLTEPKEVNDIPLDGIDWGEWSLVGIELPYHPNSNETMEIAFHAIPSSPASYFTKDRNGLMSAPVNPCMLVLLPMRDPERYISAVSFIPGGGYGYNPTLRFKDMQGIRLIYPTKSFPAGQKIYIWGIR